MSSWRQLRAHLLGTEPTLTTPTPDTESKPMPTTQITAAGERIGQLHQQLADLDTEQTGDPLDLADDPQAWRAREANRQDRRVGIEVEVRRRRRYGDLLDEQPARDAITSFTSATADARSVLEKIAADRGFARRGDSWPRDQRGAKLLRQWLGELQVLGHHLPDDHPYAVRLLREEWNRWFGCRHAWLAAMVDQDRGDLEVPVPELDASLPTGYSFGLHPTPAPLEGASGA